MCLEQQTSGAGCNRCHTPVWVDLLQDYSTRTGLQVSFRCPTCNYTVDVDIEDTPENLEEVRDFLGYNVSTPKVSAKPFKPAKRVINPEEPTGKDLLKFIGFFVVLGVVFFQVLG